MYDTLERTLSYRPLSVQKVQAQFHSSFHHWKTRRSAQYFVEQNKYSNRLGFFEFLCWEFEGERDSRTIPGGSTS